MATAQTLESVDGDRVTPEKKALVNPIDESVLLMLDPLFVEYYNLTQATAVMTHQIPLSEVRKNPKKYARPSVRDFSSHPQVKNMAIPSIDGHMVPIRVYSPDPETYGRGPYGVHVNFHGGGFMFGDLDSDALWCMAVREGVGIVVVDVDYRLCPESRFGKNIEDAWAVLQWVASKGNEVLNINPASISIGGISAGGHFTCVLQHLARDNKPPIHLRLAMCATPPVDDHSAFSTPGDSQFRSFSDFSRAPYLNWQRISHFVKHISDSDVPAWWVSPLKAENFKGLCDTFVLTAECDPLRDEGEEYARRVLAGGNMVRMRRFLGVPHPFMHIPELTQAQQYYHETCTALRQAHKGQ